MIDTNEEKRRGGRMRSFDPEEALDAAMRVFWKHGYEATSMVVLRDAMGLTPPQIYNAFTDKETLFRLALDRYLDKEAAFALTALSGPGTARTAIEQLLIGAAKAYTAPNKPGGCLFVTGALAASDQAQGIADELKARRKQSEAAIATRLRKGLDNGEVPKGANVEALAKYFVGVIHGMSIQARDGASESDLINLARTAMLVWP